LDEAFACHSRSGKIGLTAVRDNLRHASLRRLHSDNVKRAKHIGSAFDAFSATHFRSRRLMPPQAGSAQAFFACNDNLRFRAELT